MEFQKFLLDDYIKTEEGACVAQFFKNFKTRFTQRERDPEFYDFVDSLLSLPAAGDWFDADECGEYCRGRGKAFSFEDFAQKWTINFRDEYEAHDYQMCMPYFSVQAAMKCPDYAFPYLFPKEFFRFQIICKALDISLPVIPTRQRHSERCNYYIEICRALYNFRMEHGLSPLELWVLFYGFAPRFVGEFLDNSYGEANRVYLVGATQWDVEEGDLRKPTKKTVSTWQGNVDTLPGDIVIVYETSPYSRIRSIWRAISPGFDDPFRYYPGAVFLSHPVLVPPVSIAQLRADPVWSKKGLVRASMQGVNGVVCSAEEYAALKRMFKKNDPKFDLKRVPEPPSYARFHHEDLKVERDVEERLLEPLLKKIGFTSKSWKRQLPVRTGRGTCVFPDYALGVKGKGDEVAADYVWEAKYRIPTAKQLKVDLGQARSYALGLQAKALGLIAMEGVWFVTAKDSFRFDRLRHFTREQLESPDALAELRVAFGRERS